MKLKSLIVFWSTSFNLWKLLCTLGWGNISSFFSSEIEQCDSASCTNTGNQSSCVNLARGEYVCACNLHTEACPIDTSTCYPNPCGHHGTCMVNEYDRFTCECQPGWSGPICAESKTYLAFLSYVKDKFNKYQRIADADYWPSSKRMDLQVYCVKKTEVACHPFHRNTFHMILIVPLSFHFTSCSHNLFSFGSLL